MPIPSIFVFDWVYLQFIYVSSYFKKNIRDVE